MVAVTEKRTPRVVIVGAGMSGLLAGIRLREAGVRDFVILEKEADVGGTWRENRYPGLSCDVPSHLYSYSFAPNPDWTHRYSHGPEIHAYFRGIAERFALGPHLRFGAEVIEAAFTGAGWRVRTAAGDVHEGDFLVLATGVLHHPNLPDIEGLDDFAGVAFHSARWPDGLDLAGKRVGIVGTGSTATQMLPEVAEAAAHVDLYQRTAQWVFPLGNLAYGERQRARLRRFPALARLLHWWYGRIFDVISSAVLGNELLLRGIARACEKNLAQVRDPELRRRLTPDYRAACKRLIGSTRFYPAIQRENVALVTEPIARVVPEGIETADGRTHPLDVLVLATGFRPHDYMRPIKLTGEGGLTLDEAWRGGVRAHRTVTLPGFPNLFMPIGPHSPIGNYSLIDIAELQMNYWMQMVEGWREGDFDVIAPTDEACEAFNAELRGAFGKTIWLSGCQSWYLDESGLPVLWPLPFREFRRQMRRPVWSEFETRRVA